MLPLHQRLHLIRAQENCSHSEAQRILWEPRGGQSSPWADAEVKTPQKKPESDGNDVDNGSEKKGATSPSGYKALEGDEKVQACVVNLKPGLTFRQGSTWQNDSHHQALQPPPPSPAPCGDCTFGTKHTVILVMLCR